MKTVLTSTLLALLATSLSWAAPKVKWPRDVVEWEKLEEARKTAAEEEKGLAFIFVPKEWGDDKDEGVIRSIEATNDAISKLKSFCLVVKGSMQAVAQAKEGDVPKALVEGFSKAGQSYPLVVVLDNEMTTVLGATAGNAIYTEGSKVFREMKKNFREHEKAREKDDK